jgi:hypothetical protein
VVGINAVTLLTGQPGSPFALTQTGAFATSTLFSVTPPATGGGFYQVNLSNRVLSNNFLGDVVSMLVTNCAATTPVSNTCPAPGRYIELADANAVAGTATTIASVPLNTSEQQILLELTKPDPSSDAVDGYYQYASNGVPIGSPILLGTYSGLFGSGPGQLDYTQAGIVQLAPVPEPSSLALQASSIAGVAGLVWCRRRKATGPGLSSQQVTGL